VLFALGVVRRGLAAAYLKFSSYLDKVERVAHTRRK